MWRGPLTRLQACWATKQVAAPPAFVVALAVEEAEPVREADAVVTPSVDFIGDGRAVQFPLGVIAEYTDAVSVPVAEVTCLPGVGNTTSDPSLPLQVLIALMFATKRGG